jgi:hypothetical protein
MSGYATKIQSNANKENKNVDYVTNWIRKRPQ